MSTPEEKQQIIDILRAVPEAVQPLPRLKFTATSGVLPDGVPDLTDITDGVSWQRRNGRRVTPNTPIYDNLAAQIGNPITRATPRTRKTTPA